MKQNKWGRKIATVALSLTLACGAALSFAACGEEKKPPEPETKTYTVTYDLNYTGAPSATTQKVNENDKATKPADPSRENYDFTGWYTEKAATGTAYNFESKVVKDFTLYAGWEEEAPAVTEYTVTFHLNYEGAPVASAKKVNSGDTVAKPADPVRTEYNFVAWCTDEAGATPYDFTKPVTGDLPLYASWLKEGVTTHDVTFHFNYEGAPQDSVVPVEAGKTVTKPADPVKAQRIESEDKRYGYDFAKADFAGWYTESACTNEYNFSAAVDENVELFAKWGSNTYTFEAELTDLTDKQGYGYSFGRVETQLIRVDTDYRNQNASFGNSVGFLYATDLSVDFRIYSETAVENVTLTARLSAEYRDIYIAPTQTEMNGDTYYDFVFEVNGDEIDYNPIALTGAMGQATRNQRPFTDHRISRRVSLKQGWNEIKLIVANSDYFESTISAMAPMIDCIYLTTDAKLSWEPKWTNMDSREITDEA